MGACLGGGILRRKKRSKFLREKKQKRENAIQIGNAVNNHSMLLTNNIDREFILSTAKKNKIANKTNFL